MSGAALPTVQCRVVFGKKDEAVDGPDGADVVISIAATDVGGDPTVAFMRGKLKATGSTAALFDVLRSAELPSTLARLATR